MPERNHIDVYFPPEDIELFNWLNERGKTGYNKNKLMRNALECYRLFGGNITEAQLARQALAYCQQNNINFTFTGENNNA